MKTEQARQELKHISMVLFGIATNIGTELDAVNALKWEIQQLRAENERLKETLKDNDLKPGQVRKRQIVSRRAALTPDHVDGLGNFEGNPMTQRRGAGRVDI